MESEKLTERRTALLWLHTEGEACVVVCAAVLPLGSFATDQGFGLSLEARRVNDAFKSIKISTEV